MRGPALIALLLPAAFAGCVDDEASLGPPRLDARAEPARPVVVLALIDTGINPYHEEFRDLAYGHGHPRELVPGYPAGARPLPITLTARSYQEAVEEDAGLWQETAAGRLYWFPGTRIVGAISFPTDLASGVAGQGLIDDTGHGTMTASRAAGNSAGLTSLGGGEVLVVMVAGFGARSVDWVRAQSWIDIVSVSYGDLGGAVPGAGLAFRRSMEQYRDLSGRLPVFASAGNGVGNLGLLGYPSLAAGFNGLPDVITVGANDNDRLAHWGGWNPYLTADGCRNPSAVAGRLREVTNTGGGTSSAAPFAAGGGARVLLEARRILGDTQTGPRASGVLAAAGPDASLPAAGPLADGLLTLDEFKRVLFTTARPVPSVDATDGEACQAEQGASVLPATAETSTFALVGYGEVNGPSIEHALRVLRGEAPPPARPDADAAYERERAARALADGAA